MTPLTDRPLSVVVVCYRDEENVRELLRRLRPVLERCSSRREIIYVNDASPDGAEKVLLEEAARDPRLTVISHSRNFGAQVAFRTGMLQASGDAVVIMDGDLQDPPELIEDFVKRWLGGAEVIYGIRARRHEGLIRNVGYKVFYRLLRRLSYLDIPLDAGEFSLMDRAAVEVVLACQERDLLIRGLRAHAGFRQEGVPFDRPRRYAGESAQGMRHYLMWVVKSFTSFSLAPLRAISVLSLAAAAVCLLTALLYLTAYLLGFPSPRGFMTLIGLVLMCGTAVLFSQGIIAEYLGRLFIEIKARPQPVIARIVNDQRAEPRRWLGRAAP